MDYNFFMEEACKEAEKALMLREVPIGAVIVLEETGEIIGRGHNRRNTDKNALCHGEIMAIAEACKAVGDWRLEGCTMFVTVEPCPMCAGALLQCRMDRVVFGCFNRKAGSCGSIVNLLNHEGYNHKVEIVSGIMEEKCGGLMSGFFRELRKGKL